MLQMTIPSELSKYNALIPLLHELFPFKAGKSVPFLTKFYENITCIFPIICSTLSCCNNLLIFYLLYNYPLIFYEVQISTNYEKIILQFFVLSSTLARPGTILHIIWEITCIKRYKKCIILKSNWECVMIKFLIYFCLLQVPVILYLQDNQQSLGTLIKFVLYFCLLQVPVILYLRDNQQSLATLIKFVLYFCFCRYQLFHICRTISRGSCRSNIIYCYNSIRCCTYYEEKIHGECVLVCRV